MGPRCCRGRARGSPGACGKSSRLRGPTPALRSLSNQGLSGSRPGRALGKPRCPSPTRSKAPGSSVRPPPALPASRTPRSPRRSTRLLTSTARRLATVAKAESRPAPPPARGSDVTSASDPSSTRPPRPPAPCQKLSDPQRCLQVLVPATGRCSGAAGGQRRSGRWGRGARSFPWLGVSLTPRAAAGPGGSAVLAGVGGHQGFRRGSPNTAGAGFTREAFGRSLG